MLRIHKSHSKKLLVMIITSICIAFGLLGMSLLTYTPELSHAESVTYRKTINDIVYMQEMTPEICQGMELERQYKLTDIRINFNGTQPKYWVAKLRDGNCWMTQNLDLDIPNEGLSARDTDVLKDWDSNSAYAPVATQTTERPYFSNNINSVQSWDPGMKYCSTNETDGCSLVISINDNHDSVGNYYSINATTAGGNIGDESICPKGWGLPTSGRVVEKSFKNLFDAYGWVWDMGSHATNLSGGTSFNILEEPFYFVASGYVEGGSRYSAGVVGRYWSSTKNSSNIHMLQFQIPSNIVSPANDYYRYAGLSVRCIARTDAVDNNIETIINPQLSLDIVDEVLVEKSENNPSTAELDVKVSSNQKYSVGISAENPNLTSTTTNVTIPAKSGLLNTAENGWGIKFKENGEFSAVTNDLQTFYTASGAEIRTIPFTIGISTAPDIPNGEYSTEITITATQN